LKITQGYVNICQDQDHWSIKHTNVESTSQKRWIATSRNADSMLIRYYGNVQYPLNLCLVDVAMKNRIDRIGRK